LWRKKRLDSVSGYIEDANNVGRDTHELYVFLELFQAGEMPIGHCPMKGSKRLWAWAPWPFLLVLEELT
jgi:hypothetical protein